MRLARRLTVKNGPRLDLRLPADLTRRVEAHAARNKVDRSTAVRELLLAGILRALGHI
jgi:metal-responsive CopG/Arc/MetJ family transcriptional regulator